MQTIRDSPPKYGGKTPRKNHGSADHDIKNRKHSFLIQTQKRLTPTALSSLALQSAFLVPAFLLYLNILFFVPTILLSFPLHYGQRQ